MPHRRRASDSPNLIVSVLEYLKDRPFVIIVEALGLALAHALFKFLVLDFVVYHGRMLLYTIALEVSVFIGPAYHHNLVVLAVENRPDG
ncbi:hypothetical protein BDV95DRAFT_565411 [Massariosphaeria phaeospora]|uniref:Uncharacterized protein n=1 Tax=Massariosphaeria phaeospora TaxID=100035 RepID=A0A7C8I9T4_9PLEO|nr:hypothetical protein BDV95DRAFT_565411 [Massariosphaeria phaeospora]